MSTTVCEVCGKAITETSDGGYTACWSDISGRDDPTAGMIIWHPRHWGCRLPGGDGYDVPLPRTREQWRFWTDHLMGKGWGPRSNWRSIASRAEQYTYAEAYGYLAGTVRSFLAGTVDRDFLARGLRQTEEHLGGSATAQG